MCEIIIRNFALNLLSIVISPFKDTVFSLQDRKRDNQVILFAIIALEKYAQTSENRAAICKSFDGMKEHPLVVLEKMIKPGDGLQYGGGASAGLRQQVAFCAQWSLDNICESGREGFSGRWRIRG